MFKSGSWGLKAGRHGQARLARRQVETLDGPELADAIEAAIRDGRNPQPVVESAKRDLDARQQRARQLTGPPPHCGPARWLTSTHLRWCLRPKEAFNDPRYILLGMYEGYSSDFPVIFNAKRLILLVRAQGFEPWTY